VDYHEVVIFMSSSPALSHVWTIPIWILIWFKITLFSMCKRAIYTGPLYKIGHVNLPEEVGHGIRHKVIIDFVM